MDDQHGKALQVFAFFFTKHRDYVRVASCREISSRALQKTRGSRQIQDNPAYINNHQCFVEASIDRFGG
jgi:hypothetical protein